MMGGEAGAARRTGAAMSLEEKLCSMRERGRERLPPDDVRALEEAVERLRMLQVREESLVPGEPFPDFTLLDAQGQPVASTQLVGLQPLVLVFFRGGWCPYCDLTLRALEEARPRIEATGALLVAVSPEPPEHLAGLAAEKGLNFRLFCDPGLRLSRACGLHFEFTDRQVALYRRLGIDVPAHHVEHDWSVPVAASYVIDRDGMVRWSFVDPDWTRRAEPDELVQAATGLGDGQAGQEKAGA
jgi:peroxiredoxin